jgi:transcriptional regulator with XRE-family HTH domain
VNIKETRLERLRELLREHDSSRTALARKLRKSPAQVGQWLNHVRSISEESARAIEVAAKRPKGWMDGQEERKCSVLDEAMRALGPKGVAFMRVPVRLFMCIQRGKSHSPCSSSCWFSGQTSRG